MTTHLPRYLNVTHLGSQDPDERFDPNTAERQIPYGGVFRLNLTALSQQHNLYFVAYEQSIYVYEPSFPSQTLAHHPTLTIDTVPSVTHIRGTINASLPHAINHLALESLGSEEVIIVARDDGDIEVFLTRHVLNAVKARHQAAPWATTDHEVRPFCRYNVGHSAWGLAINSHARVIAVSSNEHAVTVIKLGLDPTAVRPIERPKNERLLVQNGSANIPGIAFCNTGHDPEGRWLLTTDLDGLTRSWDLIDMCDHQTIWLGDKREPRLKGAYQRRHELANSGWSVMILNPISFHDVSQQSPSQPLPGDHVSSVDTSNPIWDITCDNNKVKEAQAPQGRDNHESAAIPQDQIEMSNCSVWPTPDVVFQEPGALCADLPCPVFCTGHRHFAMLQPAHDLGLNKSPNTNTHKQNMPIIYSRDVLMTLAEIHPTADLLSRYARCCFRLEISALGALIVGNQRGFVAIYSLTKSLAKLDIKHDEQPYLKGERYVYGMSLEHILPRLDEIPNVSPDDLPNYLPDDLPDETALRLFCLEPLHGIAAGPMQGTMDLPDEKKRWRLMLMYADHRVLSYEIGLATDGPAGRAYDITP